jgi:putative flippase GtrA
MTDDPAPQQSWVAFLRFGFVGGLCFALSMLCIWLFTEGLGWHYLLSTVAAMLITNLFGWLINREWTFRVQHRRSPIEFARYVGVNLLAAGLSLGLLSLLVSGAGLHYLLACALVAASMAVLNFRLHGRWSLKARITASSGSADAAD